MIPGWHLCSYCVKNAYFMCYTCTFSLCKGCTKNAVFFRVRGNKGFCEACMRTVMLIEQNEQGNKDMVYIYIYFLILLRWSAFFKICLVPKWCKYDWNYVCAFLKDESLSICRASVYFQVVNQFFDFPLFFWLQLFGTSGPGMIHDIWQIDWIRWLI